MRLIARRLDAAGFAPFGLLTPRPAANGATIVAPTPATNLRPGIATPSLAWFAAPATAWPVAARVMERHRFSSQTFIPCGDAGWLIFVAPHRAAGGPDLARAAAFVADGQHAVTLHADTWHHPLTALAAATFAVLTCLAGDADDEEFRDLPEPVDIRAG